MAILKPIAAAAIVAAAYAIGSGWLTYFTHPEPIGIHVKPVRTLAIDPD